MFLFFVFIVSLFVPIQAHLHYYFFLTNVTWNPSLGLANADALCHSQAIARYPQNVSQMLQVGSILPNSPLINNWQLGGDIHGADTGLFIAESSAWIQGVTLQNTLLTYLSNPISGESIYWGALNTQATCANWTSSSSSEFGSGVYLYSHTFGTSTSSSVILGCDDTVSYGLLCAYTEFYTDIPTTSPVQQPTFSPTPSMINFYMFVYSTVWNPALGLASADAICTSQAQSRYPSQVPTMIHTGSVLPSSYLTNLLAYGNNIYSADNGSFMQPAADMLNNTNLPHTIPYYLVMHSAMCYWGGYVVDSQVSTSSCAFWTNNSTANGIGFSSISFTFANIQESCQTSHCGILCAYTSSSVPTISSAPSASPHTNPPTLHPTPQPTSPPSPSTAPTLHPTPRQSFTQRPTSSPTPSEATRAYPSFVFLCLFLFYM